ncbi:hypothetical protein JZ751_023968 [Albula glossodonta]|uniref:Uncharacterized protein n=1 Tax=Albula glossodonta TaxID=121402 RepID=A0A8T2NNY1_9TELE|nr:hypothetical protein JZ751_023968 [Albula glossodonta]
MPRFCCSRPKTRNPAAIRRSSRSRLARKHLCSSASTELLPGPPPLSRTAADWHSSQSAIFFMLARCCKPNDICSTVNDITCAAAASAAYLTGVPAQEESHHQLSVRGHASGQQGQLRLLVPPAFQPLRPRAVKRVGPSEDLVRHGPHCPGIGLAEHVVGFEVSVGDALLAQMVHALQELQHHQGSLPAAGDGDLQPGGKDVGVLLSGAWEQGYLCCEGPMHPDHVGVRGHPLRDTAEMPAQGEEHPHSDQTLISSHSAALQRYRSAATVLGPLHNTHPLRGTTAFSCFTACGPVGTSSWDMELRMASLEEPACNTIRQTGIGEAGYGAAPHSSGFLPFSTPAGVELHQRTLPIIPRGGERGGGGLVHGCVAALPDLLPDHIVLQLIAQGEGLLWTLKLLLPEESLCCSIKPKPSPSAKNTPLFLGDPVPSNLLKPRDWSWAAMPLRDMR